MSWRHYLQKWLVRLKITTLKVHTSLLCKSGHWLVAHGQIWGDVCQRCHRQKRKYIISLFIVCSDSELTYFCEKQWHFGVLPSRHTIENLVKLGQSVCVSWQRRWKRKGSESGRCRAWCGPNRMAEYTALTCQDRVLDMGMIAFCAHTGH